MAKAVEHDPTYRSISRSGTEALGAEITRLSACIYAATYRLLVLIREFDEQDGWHQCGLRSCAHWLNFKCGVGLGAAREKVRVAHALGDLPKISRAFEKGELSYSKVRAMTRIADESNEDYLLMIANHGTAWHMEKLVQKYRRAKRLQETDSAREQIEQRYLQYHYDEDGCLVIKARIPADQGALLVKALEKAMDKGMDAPDVSAETSDCGDKAEPIAARRADALANIAESYLQHGEASCSGGDRYQVVVHVPAETLRSTTAAHDPCIEDGSRVSAETSRRLACDCSVVPVWENAKHEPLGIGRKTRSIPPSIRRALRLRDGGCRFPGCTNTKFVDGHHIRHWADGGETNLSNLVLLCRHHHRLVHEGGYDCRRAGDGEIYFIGPGAARLPDYVAPIPVEEETYAWFEQELSQQDIHPLTCVPDWYAGENIDWNEAVSALFYS